MLLGGGVKYETSSARIFAVLSANYRFYSVSTFWSNRPHRSTSSPSGSSGTVDIARLVLFTYGFDSDKASGGRKKSRAKWLALPLRASDEAAGDSIKRICTSIQS
jgi:hypothetical protein